ncbi:hypothetical protein K1719_034250 [Acacia pycnantha]|nr:hypothetical protein K1719_034250 [Acacia pycnantha]
MFVQIIMTLVLLVVTTMVQARERSCFYPNPLLFTNTSSFSTTFVFAIRPLYQTVNCDGMAFVISPTKAIPDALVGQQEERFSSSTGAVTSFHYVLGWSFRVNGVAQNLDTSELPKLPRLGGNKQSMILLTGVPLMSLGMLFLVILSIVYYINWKKKFSEIVEEWEQDYGPQRIKYKDLYIATKGFREKELLGSGDFGSVYKGTMPGSKLRLL